MEPVPIERDDAENATRLAQDQFASMEPIPIERDDGLSNIVMTGGT